MLSDLQKSLENIRLEITKNNKTISKLIELRKEADKVFDEQLENLLEKGNLIRKIKVPKTSIPLWKHKGKRIQIPINWRYLLSAPFIYAMIFPTIIFHICVEIYQQICFRLYGIPRVNYKEYFIYDRQLFTMLNTFQKINCIYCSYVNNLLRYSTEIGGRTERYWCPIKYFRRIDNEHSQYDKFIGKEDAKEINEKWEELRDFSDLEEK